MKVKIIKENGRFVIYDKDGHKLEQTFSNKLDATQYLMKEKFNAIKKEVA